MFTLDELAHQNATFAVPRSTVDATSNDTVTSAGIAAAIAAIDITYTSALSTSTTMPHAVGGIDANTSVSTLNGRTLSQMFDLLLFPTVEPVSENASVSISNIGSLFIAGTTQNVVITTLVNDGRVTLNGATQHASWTGTINTATLSGNITGNVTLGFSGTEDVDDYTQSNYVVALGANSVTFQVTWNTSDAPMPTNTVGDDAAAVQFPAGGNTYRQATRSFEGVYPIFLGDSNGNVTTQRNPLISHGANFFECAQQYSENASVRHAISFPNDMLNGRTPIFQVRDPAQNNTFQDPNGNYWTTTSETRPAPLQPPGYPSLPNRQYTRFTKTVTQGGPNTYRIKFS